MASKNSSEELEKLAALLAVEKAADLEYHRQKILSLPLDQRVKEGYAWYQVQVVKTGYTIGSRAFVVVERSLPHTPDQFRAGGMVNLFTMQPSVRHPEEGGIIHFVERNKMKIILNTSDLPEWIGLGLVGVGLLFDEYTYLEMEKAIKKVKAASGNRLADLRDVLLGKEPARFMNIQSFQPVSILNDSQNDALHLALECQDVAVIHGPPGTGKTTTVIEIVKRLVNDEPTVLLTAPSNTAVDLLTERLADEGLQVVRIGNISRVDESLLRHTLDMQMASHPDSKNVKKLKVKAAELRRQAKQYKRSFGEAERNRRGDLFREAGEVSAWANQLEARILDQVLDGAQVITCTLVGANHSVLENRSFRTVIVDEAAQALEPATWIPILKAGRVILTGDPFQLPPTIKSMDARNGGLETTLIEKTLKRQERTALLTMQYRMHELIMGFSNARFYAGQLVAAPSVARQDILKTNEKPVVFIDTAGAGCDEKTEAAYQSRYNEEEFFILCEHLYELLDHCHAFQILPLPSFAIISPYREQVAVMKKAIAADARLEGVPITVNTIDGFQGQERDVVYISLVRSNTKNEIGFLKDYRRMNVAMTRARQKLVMVGDSSTIGNDPFYAAMLDYCQQVGTWRSAWEFMAGYK